MENEEHEYQCQHLLNRLKFIRGHQEEYKTNVNRIHNKTVASSLPPQHGYNHQGSIRNLKRKDNCRRLATNPLYSEN